MWTHQVRVVSLNPTHVAIKLYLAKKVTGNHLITSISPIEKLRDFSLVYARLEYATPEAQHIPTLSKFHCLIHELYRTNHYSSLEYAIYGTSCLLLAFLNLTICHLSNLRSINLI